VNPENIKSKKVFKDEMKIFLLFFITFTHSYKVEDHLITDDVTRLWSVQLVTSSINASFVAKQLNLTNLGHVVHDHYVFSSDADDDTDDVITRLRHHQQVVWFEQQRVLTRHNRLRHQNFEDPLFKFQWHLHNNRGLDLNVTDVWLHNITGDDVIVAIVDDGVEWRHPDLIENFSASASFDLNGDDDDPSPEASVTSQNQHGTRCAGEVAAAPNSVCGVGIAFKARFAGIRILDGLLTDALEAAAFSRRADVIDIYSCSWGPEDDGKTVDGPHRLAERALQHGVVAGRRGFGSIYLVASGNGGDKQDNCNYDGYASSIYTITIAAIDEFGKSPSYAEGCTSMITASLSSGTSPSLPRARSIVTTDWSADKGSTCTSEFSGTSAATPLAAGIVALMLQVRPCLTWRDVTHLIAITSRQLVTSSPNQAGYRHSNALGFGLMDAWRLVNAAKVWTSIPLMTSLKIASDERNLHIADQVVTKLVVTQQQADDVMLATIEHVIITVDVTHQSRGRLKYVIKCPSGTTSVIKSRPRDRSNEGLHNWRFSTVRCWGETPVGEFQLKIIDSSKSKSGFLVKWHLTVYGSSMTSSELKSRRLLVENSYSGRHIDDDVIDCPLGQPLSYDVTAVLSERTLKFISLISGFLLFWTLYNLAEDILCGVKLKSTHVTRDGYNTMTTVGGEAPVVDQVEMVNIEAL